MYFPPNLPQTCTLKLISCWLSSCSNNPSLFSTLCTCVIHSAHPAGSQNIFFAELISIFQTALCLGVLYWSDHCSCSVTCGHTVSSDLESLLTACVLIGPIMFQGLESAIRAHESQIHFTISEGFCPAGEANDHLLLQHSCVWLHVICASPLCGVNPFPVEFLRFSALIKNNVRTLFCVFIRCACMCVSK